VTLAVLCIAGAVAFVALVAFALRSIDAESLRWVQWILVLAAACVVYVLRGSAWGIWMYMVGIPARLDPPEVPRNPFGDGSLHVDVDLRCAKCGVRADPDGVNSDGVCRCAACGASFIAVRPRA